MEETRPIHGEGNYHPTILINQHVDLDWWSRQVKSQLPR